MTAPHENGLHPLATWQVPLTLRGIFTDIDDTLTTNGAITPDALAALHQLKAQGLAVVAITGRPVGWSAPFAQCWPVDAIVAENGAVALVSSRQNALQPRIGEDNPLSKIYHQDATTRSVNFARMQQVLARIEQELEKAGWLPRLPVEELVYFEQWGATDSSLNSGQNSPLTATLHDMQTAMQNDGRFPL